MTLVDHHRAVTAYRHAGLPADLDSVRRGTGMPEEEPGQLKIAVGLLDRRTAGEMPKFVQRHPHADAFPEDVLHLLSQGCLGLVPAISRREEPRAIRPAQPRPE